MRVESVNLARAVTLAPPGKQKAGKKETDKTIETGIFKNPVSGQVAVTESGLSGDTIINTRVHGGVDQAVYIYLSEDYAWWSQTLAWDIAPGTFGENLTLSGLASHTLCIGDRLTIADVVLELTAPRVPCSIFAARMDDPAFLKQFIKANRPGVYARVLQVGHLQQGDTVSYRATEHNYPSIADIFRERHAKHSDADLLARALASPMSRLLKPNLQQKLDALKTP